MIKRPFFCFSKSYLAYDKMTGPPVDPQPIPVSKKSTYIVKSAANSGRRTALKPGMKVKTGQKLAVNDTSAGYAISSVTGKVAGISGYAGDNGETWTEVTVDVAADEDMDEGFKAFTETPDLETASAYLHAVPGAPDLTCLTDTENPIHTIVVNAMERDLMSRTAQYIATAEIEHIVSGIRILKQLSGVETVIMAVPRDIIQGYGHIGAMPKAVDTLYPSGHPVSIMKNVLDIVVPAGKSCEELGVAFFSPEAVASIGKAFDTGVLPVDKTVTVVDKRGNRTLITSKIGTPVRDIFETLGIYTWEKDRIILGGPMTGTTIYTEDHPVEPDTDIIIVQDGGDIPFVSDYPCVNCGECIKVCPTNVPVHMLVRFLEAGQWEQAADEYDLYSCIDCGLCSFVCVSKIPIFQYIKLGKFELDRINMAEASNG